MSQPATVGPIGTVTVIGIEGPNGFSVAVTDELLLVALHW